MLCIRACRGVVVIFLYVCFSFVEFVFWIVFLFFICSCVLPLMVDHTVLGGVGRVLWGGVLVVYVVGVCY